MSTIPFILSKRKDSPYFYVRFRNESTGGYLSAISTKETNKKKAESTAWNWYKTGQIGTKKYTLDDCTILNDLQKASDDVLIQAVQELKKRGLVKAFVYSKAKNAIKASDFLIDFWTWGKSQYINEKIRRGQRIGKTYCLEGLKLVKSFWVDYLKDKVLGELTRQDIDDFIDIVADMNLANGTRNHIIQAGTIPLKWANNKGLIESDITSGIMYFRGETKEREILTPELASTLFSLTWRDERSKLANLLAMCTGLRAGEIQALRLRDIGADRLYINHSWNRIEGLKCTKNGESRIVYLPFPQLIKALKELGENNPYNQGLNGFVFWATSPDTPMGAEYWLRDLRVVLDSMGAESKKYTFHSWRHYYSTYMAERVNQKALQTQTGHKTRAMLEHYADHTVNADIEHIEKAQTELFGDIVQQSTVWDFDYSKRLHYVQAVYK